jgi:hypothetical protein
MRHFSGAKKWAATGEVVTPVTAQNLSKYAAGLHLPRPHH